MGCVVYSLTELFLSALMMNTYSVTTNFLERPASSHWLRLSSQWERLCVFEVVVNVFFLWEFSCVCVCVCVHVYARGPVLRGSAGLF